MQIADGTLRYAAAPGETNNVTFSVSLDPYAYVFTDPGAIITVVGDGCTLVNSHEASCSASGFWYVAIDAGDLNDNVTAPSLVRVDGGPGNDTLAGGTLFGGPGNDVLNGTEFNDGLDGGSGDDTLNAGDGLDSLSGGLGADTLNGGEGGDGVSYIERTVGVTVDLDGALRDDGEPGEQDTVGADVERISGGSGDDVLTGNGSFNDIYGGAGNDTLSGLGADDYLYGDPGADTYSGGAGADWMIYYTSSDLIVDLDGVADDGTAGEQDNVGTDVENLQGGPGNDLLVGNDANNVLNGRYGTDTLRGGGGADVLETPDFGDTADYSDHTSPVSITLDGIANDGQTGENDAIDNNIVRIVGGAANDTLIGNDNTNWLDGGPGNDVIDARGGPDHYFGGAGDDLLVSGPPPYVGGDSDVFAGGDGSDIVDYSARTNAVRVDLDGQADDGQTTEGENVGVDVEGVLGGAGNDTLTGNNDGNTLDGGAGDDRLSGRLGADTIRGGDGRDLVDYSERAAPVLVDLDGLERDDGEADEFDTVGVDVEDILGGTGGDTLVGNASDNFLEGGAGGDTMDGGAGVDRLDYSQRTQAVRIDFDNAADDGEADEHDNVTAFEIVLGGTGDDVIVVGNDPSTVTGAGGNDDLTGGEGDDVLDGGPGHDYLDGRFGSDRLVGGRGFDFAAYDERSVRVRADLDGAADDGEAGEGDRIEADVEGLVGGEGSDVLAGNGGKNVIYGGPRDDIISGLGGGDLLIGEDGADALAGGDGGDAFVGGPGADTFSGGAGFDFADYSARTAAVRVDLDGARDDGQVGEKDNVRTDVEGVVGGRGADRLIGNGKRNSVVGGPGNDYLVGGGGIDGHWGEGGADTIIARDGTIDLAHGGKGSDRASVDRGLDVIRSIERFL